MLVYIQLYAILALLGVFHYQTKQHRDIFAYIGIFIASVFIGYRDLSLGTDTERYFEIYNDIRTISEALIAGNFGFDAARVETGFVLFAGFMKEVGASFPLFLSAMNVLAFTILFETYKRFDKENAFFLFLIYLGTFSFFTLHYNILRQGVAAAFCFAAIYQLSLNKNARFFILVILGASFHSIAVTLLPLWVLKRLKLNRVWFFIYYILIAIFSVYGMLAIVVKLLSPFSVAIWRVANYMQTKSGELSLLSLSFILDVLLLIYCTYDYRYLKQRFSYFDLVFKAYMMGLAYLVAFHDLQLLAMRMFYLFAPLEVLLFYTALSRIQPGLLKVLLIIIFAFVWFFKNLFITAQFMAPY